MASLVSRISDVVARIASEVKTIGAEARDRVWPVSFIAPGSEYLAVPQAMTIDLGGPPIGSGTLAYAKSTAAAPGTFAPASLPVALEAGAWLRVTASGVTGFVAARLRRVADVVTFTKHSLDGDSINVNAGGPVNQWAGAHPTIAVTNFAVSGSGIGSLEGRAAQVDAAAADIHVVDVGANDLQGFPSAQAYADRLFAYAAARKAAKPARPIGVVLVRPGSAAGHNALRNQLNALLRAAVGGAIDFIVPIGEHPVSGRDAAAGNPAFYDNAGLHPVGEAVTHGAAIYEAVLTPAIGRDASASPDPFTLTDNNNAAPNSDHFAYATVTGLALGQTATASVTGAGSIARGTGTLGTANVSVMNGDIVPVRITSSATGGPSRSAELTIGGVSDTLTVTTAGAVAAVDFASGSYLSAPASITNPETLQAVAFAAGRAVIFIAVNNSVFPTAVSVGGIACTNVDGWTNQGGETLWIGDAPIPAGDHVVIATMASGFHSEIKVMTGTLTGNVNPASVSTAALSNAYRNQGIMDANLSCIVPAGGVCIFAARSDPSAATAAARNGATILSNFGNELFWAKFNASGVPSFSKSDGGNTMIVAASFGPA